MNFFQNVLRSFYDFNFYKDVRANWKGWGLGYTTAVFTILIAIGLAYGINVLHNEIMAKRDGGRPSVFEESLRQIAAQWPDTMVVDNTLKSDAPMPHVIKVEMDIFGDHIDEPFMTIDTTDTTTYATMTTPVLITSKELILKKEKDHGVDETKIHPLEEFFKDAPQPFKLDAAKMNEFVTVAVDATSKHIWKFYAMMGVITWIIAIPIMLILRILLLIPVAVAGLLVAKIMKRDIDYDSAVRVIAIALIPLTLIEVFALLAFGSGVSVWIKVVVSLGILAALLNGEPKKA